MLAYNETRFLQSLDKRPTDFHQLATRPKIVFFLISNCGKSVHSDRMKYIKELRKHIGVDGYGHCGRHKCKYLGGSFPPVLYTAKKKISTFVSQDTGDRMEMATAGSI